METTARTDGNDLIWGREHGKARQVLTHASLPLIPVINLNW